MKKFLETRDEVVELVHSLSERPELKPFKLGVAGSYVTGLNKKASPIDIVLKLREGESKDWVGSLVISRYIHRDMEDVYSNKIRIIWLDLLEKDEEELLDFVATNGFEANPESAYTNIVGEIRWVDEVDSSDDEDRISSTVVTFDEEEDEE
jgi:hypothetical protein